MRSPSTQASDRGDLSTFLAAALVIPLLLLLLFGGFAADQVATWTFEVQHAAAEGLMVVEADGGITSMARTVVTQNIQADALLSRCTVSVQGPAPTVPWGEPVWIEVTVSVPPAFPLSLIEPTSLNIHAKLYGTSNAPPL